ncbi:hypothetical protein [Iamia sp.]|uniref:hypothetical protein n=1 Tax=Iamia sp. TaxID=2722710 RepID=UPI002BD01839|nr:hypothetical protein [Iamia sp.]HXH59085.1 hypothetical protein [Iamia sp.]
MTTWRIPRESLEAVGPLAVTANGVPVTNFSVAVIPRGERPVAASWQAPLTIGTGKYVPLIGPGATVLPPGSYTIWVRYTANPETPVLDSAGTIIIT